MLPTKPASPYRAALSSRQPRAKWGALTVLAFIK
jgi:hypothetical protein